MQISKIILYDEPTVPEIQIQKTGKFIADTLNVETQVRANFFQSKKEEKIFEKTAAARVFDLKGKFVRHAPTPNEILIEKEDLETSEKNAMILYDGFELQNIITEFIPKEENRSDTLHIILTNKLTATFDQDDFRYHARSLIGTNPTIISTTGMIEAPAKPKQYYLDLMTDQQSEEKIREIGEKYKGQFLEYHDSRLDKITEGYVLQSIVYYVTGEAFCEDKGCRLFNAHWQKELFYTQIENRKLCKKHSEIINEIKNKV